MGLSLAACGGSKKTDNNAGNNAGGTEAVEQGSESGTESANAEYDENSSTIYKNALGEFGDMYQPLRDEQDLAKRYANMALAEAKLLESAVMLPTSSQGGRYAMSRAAYRTADYTLWGSDNDRLHAVIITKELIKKADREKMKEEYKKLQGTGKYRSWVKDFLKKQGYTLAKEYGFPNTSDAETWDVLSTQNASDTDILVQTYDGLMEYDGENVLQPALAEKYEVSDDGLTYTFHIRKNVEWVDSQGRKVDTVKADDFVAGMQHVYDTECPLSYLVDDLLVNAKAYKNGEVTDFGEVGVKAADENTLVYTLSKPCSYFMTMLGYSIFAPLCRSYYESMGGKFGSEFDSSAADYKYGKSHDTIAYCGPFLVTKATAKNSIIFEKNKSYWNPENVSIDKINYWYNDDSDPTKIYNDIKSGTLAGASLNTSALELAKKDKLMDEYAYVSDNDATTFNFFYNLNRVAFANTNDKNVGVSKKNDDQKEASKKAMSNVHFRRAISFAVDRANYEAQRFGEDVKYNMLRNTYTPGNFVKMPEDVTVSINGTDTTFKKGTDYGVIVQAQIDADGVKIKAYDPKADDGLGSSDGFDGWYNPEEAKKEMKTAIDELSKDGLTIDKSNPIVLEIPYPSGTEVYTNMLNAYKQSVEKALEGQVIISLIDVTDTDKWMYCGYQTSYGYEANYDVYDLSGWGPDYGDPSTYLDTFLPDYNGAMTKCLGIF
jgi:ABC-type oligopeptide transport system substrate-binding subunit